MIIPPEISSIVERLYLELDEIEQQAVTGQNLARIILDQKKLDEALDYAQQVNKKIQEFDFSSGKVAEKWQKKVENQEKKVNK